MVQVGAEISRRVWKAKYRYQQEGMIAESWRRIARALAMVEKEDHAAWERRFFGILQEFKFLPGGRIQAGAGTERNVTLFNCFVMGTIEDSITGIFTALEEGAITMQQGAEPDVAANAQRQRRRAALGNGQQQGARANPFGRPGAALPQLTGIAQVIGLALGSPEFQRR